MSETPINHLQSQQLFEVNPDFVLSELVTRVEQVPIHPWSEGHQVFLEDFDEGVLTAIASLGETVSINWVLLNYLRVNKMPKTEFEVIKRRLGTLVTKQLLMSHVNDTYSIRPGAVEFYEQLSAKALIHPTAKSPRIRVGIANQSAEVVGAALFAQHSKPSGGKVSGESAGTAQVKTTRDNADSNCLGGNEEDILEPLQLPAEPKARRIASIIRNYILGSRASVNLSKDDLEDSSSIYLGCRIAMRDDNYGDEQNIQRVQDVMDILYREKKASENSVEPVFKMTEEYKRIRAYGNCRHMRLEEFIPNDGRGRGNATKKAQEACLT